MFSVETFSMVTFSIQLFLALDFLLLNDHILSRFFNSLDLFFFLKMGEWFFIIYLDNF